MTGVVVLGCGCCIYCGVFGLIVSSEILLLFFLEIFKLEFSLADNLWLGPTEPILIPGHDLYRVSHKKMYSHFKCYKVIVYNNTVHLKNVKESTESLPVIESL